MLINLAYPVKQTRTIYNNENYCKQDSKYIPNHSKTRVKLLYNRI